MKPAPSKPKETDLLLQILRAWGNATEEARQDALAYLQATVGNKRH